MDGWGGGSWIVPVCVILCHLPLDGLDVIYSFDFQEEEEAAAEEAAAEEAAEEEEAAAAEEQDATMEQQDGAGMAAHTLSALQSTEKLANGMEWEEEEDTGLDWLCPDNIDAAGEPLNSVRL